MEMRCCEWLVCVSIWWTDHVGTVIERGPRIVRCETPAKTVLGSGLLVLSVVIVVIIMGSVCLERIAFKSFKVKAVVHL